MHFGCECCGGDSYDDDSWDEMVSTHHKTEEKIKKFCDENNLVYDWGVFDDDDLAKLDFVNKTSFDSLFSLFSNANLKADPVDYEEPQDYFDMKDYYAEDTETFVKFCQSLGFEKDKNSF